jgi:hypothetical protein
LEDLFSAGKCRARKVESRQISKRLASSRFSAAILRVEPGEKAQKKEK